MATARAKRERRERRYSNPTEAAEKRDSGFERTTMKLPEGAKIFQLKKAGTYRIDILPYEVQEGANNPYAEEGFLHYERTYFVHRNVGANNDAYVCPAKTSKKSCPICEHRVELGKDEDADDALIKDLLPKERQLFNVIDLSDTDAGVQIWDISYHLFGKLLNTKLRNADEGDNYDAFAHLEDGLTLKITAEEKSFGGRTFYEVADIEFKPRKEQYDDDMLEKVYDLDGMLKEVDYDTLRKTFLQIDDDDEDAHASNGKAPKTKSGPKGKPPVDDDEDDSDLEEDSELEDDSDLEEEPKPKPKAKGGKKKPSTAADKGLDVGDDVMYKGEEYEIARISKDGTSLTLEDEDEELIKAVGVDEVTAAPKKTKPKGKPAKDEDWEDEDEDEDEDEEPAPKKKPAKAAAGKKSKPVDDDDDDDDDEDW